MTATAAVEAVRPDIRAHAARMRPRGDLRGLRRGERIDTIEAQAALLIIEILRDPAGPDAGSAVRWLRDRPAEGDALDYTPGHGRGRGARTRLEILVRRAADNVRGRTPMSRTQQQSYAVMKRSIASGSLTTANPDLEPELFRTETRPKLGNELGYMVGSGQLSDADARRVAGILRIDFERDGRSVAEAAGRLFATRDAIYAAAETDPAIALGVRLSKAAPNGRSAEEEVTVRAEAGARGIAFEDVVRVRDELKEINTELNRLSQAHSRNRREIRYSTVSGMIDASPGDPVAAIGLRLYRERLASPAKSTPDLEQRLRADAAARGIDFDEALRIREQLLEVDREFARRAWATSDAGGRGHLRIAVAALLLALVGWIAATTAGGSALDRQAPREDGGGAIALLQDTHPVRGGRGAAALRSTRVIAVLTALLQDT